MLKRAESRAACPECNATTLRFLFPLVAAFFDGRKVRTHQEGAQYDCADCGTVFRVLPDGVRRIRPKAEAKPADPNAKPPVPPGQPPRIAVRMNPGGQR